MKEGDQVSPDAVGIGFVFSQEEMPVCGVIEIEISFGRGGDIDQVSGTPAGINVHLEEARVGIQDSQHIEGAFTGRITQFWWDLQKICLAVEKDHRPR